MKGDRLHLTSNAKAISVSPLLALLARVLVCLCACRLELARREPEMVERPLRAQGSACETCETKIIWK